MPQNDDDTYTIDPTIVADLGERIEEITIGQPAIEAYLALLLVVRAIGANIDPGSMPHLEKWLLATEHAQEGPQ